MGNIPECKAYCTPAHPCNLRKSCAQRCLHCDSCGDHHCDKVKRSAENSSTVEDLQENTPCFNCASCSTEKQEKQPACSALDSLEQAKASLAGVALLLSSAEGELTAEKALRLIDSFILLQSLNESIGHAVEKLKSL